MGIDAYTDDLEQLGGGGEDPDIKAELDAATARRSQLFPVPRRQATPATPSGPIDSGILKGLIDESLSAEAKRLRTIAGSDKTSPEDAARALTLSRQTGIPSTVYSASPDTFKGGIGPDYEKLLQQSPELAKWLGENANNQAVSKGDLGVLGMLSELLGLPAKAYARSAAQENYSDVRFKQVFGSLYGSSEWTDADQQQLEYNQELMNRPVGDEDSWWKAVIAGPGSFIANQITPLKYMATGAVTSGALGALIGGVPGAIGLGIAGAKAGGLYGVGKSTFVQESVGAYDDYGKVPGWGVLNEPLDEGARKMAALAVGGLNAPIEMGIQAWLFARIPGINTLGRGMIRATVRDALAKPTVRAALGELAKEYTKELTAETTQEVVQKAINILGQDVATTLSNAKTGQNVPHMTLAERGTQLADEAKGAAAGFALGMLPTPVARFVSQRNQVAQAHEAQEWFTQVGTAVKGSETFNRSPLAVQQFIEQHGGVVDKVYMPVEAWTTYWQDKGFDPSEIADKVTGRSGALEEAKQTEHGQLEIDTSRYATTIAPTDHNAKLSQELRFGDPYAMNAREADEFDKTMKASRDNTDVENDPVHQSIVEQLTAAGVGTNEANNYARYFTERNAALAERSGLWESPHEMFQHYGLEVGREAAAVAGQHFYQPQLSVFDLPPHPTHPQGSRMVPFPVTTHQEVEPLYRAADLTHQVVKTVPLSQVVATQESVNENIVAQKAAQPEEGRAVQAIEYNGKYYLIDGTHAAVAAWQRGETTLQVRATPVNVDQLSNPQPYRSFLDRITTNPRELFQGPRLPHTMTAPTSFENGRLYLSTAVPTSVDAPPLSEPIRTDMSRVFGDPKMEKKFADVVRDYPQLTPDEQKLDDKQLLEAFIERGKRNLKFLYDQAITAGWGERAKRWYVGAHKIAGDLATKYGVTIEQASAVLAALSPQMDWFKNVSLAERVFENVKRLDEFDPQFTEEDFAHFKARALVNQKSRARQIAKKKGDEAAQRYIDKSNQDIDAEHDMVGLSWKQMDLDQQAIMLRVTDERNGDPSYHIILPEGEKGELKRNKPQTKAERLAGQGPPSKVGWGTYIFISNAISAIHDGSHENLSQLLGGEHKVRSFFNNINDPWNGDSVTIDTHAVAALLLEALSGSDDQVYQTMNGPANNLTGISGVNALYAEAYFQLAADLGIEARELQSVTWEAVRGLFAPEQKKIGSDVPGAANALWRQFHEGTITEGDLYHRLLEAASGIAKPDWVDTAPRVAYDEGQLRASDEAGRAGVSAGRGGGGPGAEGTTRRYATAAERPLQVETGVDWSNPGLQKLAAQSGFVFGPRSPYAVLLDKLGRTGGFTYDTNAGMQRVEGYAVSPYEQRTQRLFAGGATVDALAAYVARNADILSQPGHHFGAWNDTEAGVVYLDVSIIADTPEQAQQVAVDNNQLAYFDLGKKEEVRVQPSGALPGAAGQEGLAVPGGPPEAVPAANREGAIGGGGRAREAAAALYQSAPRGPRGRLTFSEDRRQFRLDLLASADLSTFIHEAAHYFFEVFTDIKEQLEKIPAEQRSPSQQQILDDYASLEKATGKTERRDIHEAVAAMTEAYAHEGKAPSAQLRPVFARFRAWMIGVYSQIHDLDQHLGVRLTNEVRAVFDRMHATDQAIEQAQLEGETRPMFLTAEAAGMTRDEFEAYRRTVMDAGDRERQKLDLQLLSEVQRERSEAWKNRRAEVQAEVESATQQQPIWQALAAIKTGLRPDGTALVEGVETNPLKLSKQELEARGYGKATMEQLRRRGLYAAKDGVSADLVARMFGFGSGDELVQALLTAPRFDDVVQAETDKRMIAEHGSMLLDGSLEERAREAVADEHRDAVVRAELRALARKQREVAPFLRPLQERARGAAAAIRGALPAASLVKASAEQKIAQQEIRQIKPQVYWSAARNAAVKARDLAARQDISGAIQAAQGELFNLAAYREATRVLRDVEDRVRYAQSLTTKARRSKIGLAGGAYLEQVDGILDRFEFADVPDKQLARRDDIREWVKGLEAQGMPVDIPDYVLTEAYRKNYRTMTYTELVDVTDSLHHIVHLSQLKNKLLKAQEQREFEAVRDEVVDTIRTNVRERPQRLANVPGDKKYRLLDMAYSTHLKLATIIDSFDKVDNGPFWNAFMRPLNEAANAETEMKRTAGTKLGEIIKAHYTALEVSHWHNLRHIDGVGELSLDHMLAVALNWGNQEGRDRLTHDVARKWNEQQVVSIINELSDRDLSFVKAVWAYLEEFWPEIAAKQKRVTGLAPDRVEPAPFTVRGVEMPGGYYPLVYDRTRDPKQIGREVESTAKLKVNAGYVRNQTKHGHVETRQQHVLSSLLLNVSPVLAGHVDQVIHDLTHHETLIDVSRLLRDPKVARAILDTKGDVTYEQLAAGLEAVTAGTANKDALSGIVDYMRTGVQVAGLAYNVWTALQQPFGMVNGMERVGARWVMRGIGRILADPMHANEWVNEKSAMMRHRGSGGNTQDMRELRETMSKPGGWADTILSTVTGDRLTKKTIVDSMLWHIQVAQRVADMPTWVGMYLRGMEETNGDEKTAIAMADQAVLDSQGGADVKDLARVQRGGAFMKLYMTFYSYANMTLNASIRAAGRTNFKSPSQVLAFMGHLGMIYALPSVFTSALAYAVGKKSGDLPEWLEDVGTDMLAQAINGWVLFRELAGLAQEGNRGYEGPAGARVFGLLYNLGGQIKQGEADEGLLKALNRAGGVLLHYPSAQLERTVRGIVALEEGTTSNPFVILTGPPPKEKP